MSPAACSCKFFFADSAFAFIARNFIFVDQAAKILVPGAGRGEKGKPDLTTGGTEAQRNSKQKAYQCVESAIDNCLVCVSGDLWGESQPYFRRPRFAFITGPC